MCPRIIVHKIHKGINLADKLKYFEAFPLKSMKILIISIYFVRTVRSLPP